MTRSTAVAAGAAVLCNVAAVVVLCVASFARLHVRISNTRVVEACSVIRGDRAATERTSAVGRTRREREDELSMIAETAHYVSDPPSSRAADPNKTE